MTFTSYSAEHDTDLQYAPWFASSRNAIGVQVVSGGGLDGITASQLTFKVEKNASPTGDVYARIYTPSNGGLGTLQATSAAVDFTTISSGVVNFPLLANYTLQADDMICVLTDPVPTVGEFAIGRDTANTQPSDFDNSQATPNWEVSGDYYSTYLIVTTGAPPPVVSSTFLPPPPAMVRL